MPLPRYILRKQNILRALRSILPEIESFVDIGCGAGDLACTLAELGLVGTAYDFSRDAIDMARSMQARRSIDGARLRFVHSQDSLEQMQGTYDLVLCMEVLEHIEDDAAAFAELVRLTNKYLILSVPAKRCLFGASDTLAGHYRRYDRSDLEGLIRHEEMEVVTQINYGFPFTQLSRFFLERGARRELAAASNKGSPSSKAELSKSSGIHVFSVPKLLGKIQLERSMMPLYQFSRLFNHTDLSEGYLVVLARKDKVSDSYRSLGK